MASATTSPCWFRPVCFMVTIPWPGRDEDSRFPVTTVSVYRVSPWYIGCGKDTSVRPSWAMMVPWVSCGTDCPTTVARVNMEFIRRWPNGCSALQAASRCRAWVFMVMVVKRTLSASVTVRPGRCA